MALPTRHLLTAEQEQALVEARIAFMTHCQFFCYYYYDQLTEYATTAIPTAATDGKRVFFNPVWFANLRPPERCFVLAHETYHAVWGHSKRIRYYHTEKTIEGVPFIKDLFNIAADYVINADLIENKIGLCNPEWLYDKTFSGTDKIEEVYKTLYGKLPPPPPPRNPCDEGDGEGKGQGQQQGQGEGEDSDDKPNDEAQDQPGPVITGSIYGRGSQPDKRAAAAGGRFDEVNEPHVDPVSAVPDEIDEITHKEAVSRAISAAKAIGNVPWFIERLVEEIINPQVNWREHIRMILTGKLGSRRETWLNPNRRRLVLNPIVYMPGKKGHGAELVAVWIDNSGSIGKAEYNAFFSEIGGILVDVKPKRLLVGWCDAVVRRTEWASSLEEFWDHAYKPTPGGGGTSFVPPFQWMKANDVEPETVVYLTDGYGPFGPRPGCDVVWCMTTDVTAPWGETVRIHA
jgi:predicted metal-dependent peptidase